MMLRLKLQYFGHLMRRVDSLEKTLMLGRFGGGRKRDDRGWDGWMASLTRWTWVWGNSGSWWWTGRPGVLWFMGSQRFGHDWATELKWTESVNYSVVSNSLWPHLLKPSRLLCPWNSPDQNTEVGSHTLLQGIFPTQGSNPGLLHCRQIIYCLNYQGNPIIYILNSK